MKLGIGVLVLAGASLANAAVITLNGSGGAVPDNDSTGVSFDVATVDTRTVTAVELFIKDISHTFIGDLFVTLRHSTGAVTLNVLNLPLNNSDRLVAGGTYTFANGGGDIGAGFNGDVPFGTYAPLDDFAAFNGVPANGVWRLFISDNAGADISNDSWTWGVNLTVEDVSTPPVTSAPEPSSFSLLGLALAGLAYRLRK